MTTSAVVKLLRATVSCLALASSPALAQETPSQETPAPAESEAPPPGDVVVTGTRASLENAERVKRDSVVVMDGIAADDISALPDASIADSLVRVAGITANDGPRGPDAISIRGLGPDLSTTTVDGRLLATASGVDRRISLAELPTEGIAAAYVQKTPEAATAEGGVAGTLNLLTIRPLDTSRRGLTLVLRGLGQDNASALRAADHYGRLGARGEITYVGKLTDNLGIAATYSYLRQYSGFVGQQIDSWQLGTGPRADVNGDGVPDALPTNVGVTSNYNDDLRHSALGSIQWRPGSDVRVTLDGMFVSDLLYSGPDRFFANNIYNGTLGAADSATVDDTNTAQAFSGEVALYRDVLNESRQLDRTYAGGLNVAVDKGPVKATFDVSYSHATRDTTSPQATIATAGTIVQQRRPFSYDISDPDHVVLDFAPTSASDYSLGLFQDSLTRIHDTIKAAKADFEVDPGVSFLKSIQFGFKVDRREHGIAKDATQYTYGAVAAKHPLLDDSYLQLPDNPFANLAKLFGGHNATNFPYFDIKKIAALRDAPGVIVSDQMANDVGGSFGVNEDTAALYGQINIDAGPFKANLGLRYVITDGTVTGATATVTEDAPLTIVPVTVNHSYHYLLPAINARYEITHDLIARAAYSETFSRQQFADLAISSAIDLTSEPTGVLTISQGNPNLSPFTARGFDLGLEWYPDSSTSIAVDGYVKYLKNFLSASTVATTVTLDDGTVVPAIIQSVVNDPKTRDLRGIEVSVRKDFNFLPGFLKNFGVQGNLNYNYTDAIQTTSSLVGNVVNASADLYSKFVANGQFYYSDSGIDLRLAYRYFDPYVRAFFNSYQEQPFGQIDLSASVAVLGNVRLIGSVTNLTKARIRRWVPDYRDSDNHGLTQLTVYQGRTVTLGIRATL